MTVLIFNWIRNIVAKIRFILNQAQITVDCFNDDRLKKKVPIGVSWKQSLGFELK